MCLLTVLGSQGIVVKCGAAIFSPYNELSQNKITDMSWYHHIYSWTSSFNSIFQKIPFVEIENFAWEFPYKFCNVAMVMEMWIFQRQPYVYVCMYINWRAECITDLCQI